MMNEDLSNQATIINICPELNVVRCLYWNPFTPVKKHYKFWIHISEIYI